MAFNPAAHPDCVYYIPPFGGAAGEPLDFWQQISSVSTHPAATDDPIGTIETDIDGVLFTGATAAGPDRRIRLGAGSGIKATAADQGLRHAGNKTRARTFHENQTMFVIVAFKMTNGVFATRVMMDNTNVSATNPGFYVGSQNQTTHSRFKVQLNNNGATVWTIQSDEAISDGADHIGIGYLTPTLGESYVQVDDGKKVYQNATAGGSAVDATFDTFLLNRASYNTQWDGEVYAMAVYSAHPGQDEIDSWFATFTKGNISGSPELRVGDFHLNLDKTQRYIFGAIWANGYRISTLSTALVEHGGNTVINDGVSTGNGWAGGPHGSETVNSVRVWVDGTEGTFADGNIYEGESTVTIERQSTLGISFDYTQTLTVGDHYTRDRTQLVRLDDARTVGTVYIIRNPRIVDFKDWASFDRDGDLLDEGTVTATNGDLTTADDEAAIALAQWSPLTGTMSLIVITQTNCTDYDWLIVGAADNRRVYIRVYDSVTGEGTTAEMEALTKYYATDAGSWKALAQSELLGILSGNGDFSDGGFGIGLGLDL